MGFSTATLIHNKRAELIFLSTGSRELDKLLQAETGSIIDLFGEFQQVNLKYVITCQVIYLVSFIFFLILIFISLVTY
jgi:DNA repair protein RAD51